MEKKLRFAYDKDGDVLDISIGNPQKGISVEVEDDFFTRKDTRSGEIIGFSILNFREWFKNLQDYRTIPVSARFNLIREK